MAETVLVEVDCAEKPAMEFIDRATTSWAVEGGGG